MSALIKPDISPAFPAKALFNTHAPEEKKKEEEKKKIRLHSEELQGWTTQTSTEKPTRDI